MLSSFVFLIYFVCINVSFIVIQYIHADKSEHTLDPGASGPADMKPDGRKETDLSKIPGGWDMSLSRGTSESTGRLERDRWELTVCSVAGACVGTVISTRPCQRGGEMEARLARRSPPMVRLWLASSRLIPSPPTPSLSKCLLGFFFCVFLLIVELKWWA